MDRFDAVSFGSETIAGFVARYPAGTRFVVAFSGGADSLALLHAFTAARPRGCTPNLRAIHVDHHLHPDSTRWARHCMEICHRLSVELTVLGVHIKESEAARSDEGAARALRYRAFERTLASGDVLCTAHSEDDHVETVLLNLLRGAGPRGLAGIPHERRLGEGIVARPVRGVARAALRAYARETGLAVIQDPANEDQRFARVLLRRRVVPVLEARWPGMRGKLAQAAELGRESAELLDALAAIDLDPAGGIDNDSLDTTTVAALDPARRRNAIAGWLRARGIASPRFTPDRADCPRGDRGEGGCDAVREARRHRHSAFSRTAPPGPARTTVFRAGRATMADPGTSRIRPRRPRMRALPRRRAGRHVAGHRDRGSIPWRRRSGDATDANAGTIAQEAFPVAGNSPVGAWTHPARVCRRHSRGHRLRVDQPAPRGRTGNAGLARRVDASTATTSRQRPGRMNRLRPTPDPHASAASGAADPERDHESGGRGRSAG